MSELRQANTVTSGPAIVFLPGILMPATLRYAPLVREMGDSVRCFTKELEVYEPGGTGDNHSIEAEVAGVSQAADAAGLERFYLYGHSGGGAVAIAYATAHPGRVIGLALDEPASDFSDETKLAWTNLLNPLRALPASERVPAFMGVQVAPGVSLPTPAPGPPPEWMATRPAGIDAFIGALDGHVLTASPSTFTGPVYYSLGSLTNPIWRQMRDRLGRAFPNFTSEEYEGLHHLNTSNVAEPSRVAGSLRRVWGL